MFIKPLSTESMPNSSVFCFIRKQTFMKAFCLLIFTVRPGTGSHLQIQTVKRRTERLLRCVIVCLQLSACMFTCTGHTLQLNRYCLLITNFILRIKYKAATLLFKKQCLEKLLGLRLIIQASFHFQPLSDLSYEGCKGSSLYFQGKMFFH